MDLCTLVLSLSFLLQSAPPPATAEAPPPAVQKTVEDTASPDLVRRLVKDLEITPAQAEGSAGALLGLAKSRLTPEEFAKVAAAVPNIDGLLKAAPVKDGKTTALALASTTTGTGGIGGIAGLTGSFAKMGLKPETMTKLAPALLRAIEPKGGAEVTGLLARVLK